MSLKTGFNKKRLRRLLALFSLCLAIPGLILVYQAFTQMKWESYRQHQLMAEELVDRINSDLIQLIDKEDLRPTQDFNFFNNADQLQQNILQRSPLSALPSQQDIPGLIGYFQVDHLGQLSTPLLPAAAHNISFPPSERQQRNDIQEQLLDILISNRLVPAKRNQTTHTTKSKRDVIDSEISTENDGRAFSSISSLSDEIATSTQNSFDLLDQKMMRSLEKAAPSRQQNTQSLGRVEELKLEAQFEDRIKETPSSPTRKKSARKEPMLATSDTADKVTTFESEVDPLTFSQLDSGHFVLFRKVWRNGQRLTQGLILEQSRFLNDIINKTFTSSRLASMSTLITAYQGDILAIYSGNQHTDYLARSKDITGELLYRTRLLPPLSDIELIFNINKLPAGTGTTVILWVAIAFALVLISGVLLMYRLVCKQLDLAQQQQDFISAVSHELKTPLTSIRMYAEMLREGWADPQKKTSYYQYIFDESERLSRLINNVLQLARMNRNELHLNLNKMQVSTLIDSLRSKLSSQAEQHHFQLTIDNLTPDDTRINIDHDALLQVMINLVDNAIKFSAKSESKRIEIIAKTLDQQYVSLSVRDFGPGIAKHHMKKIFGLFYRSENELTRETVGTGIGLALVSQLVTEMGGEIDVINREPGAEFVIRLPLAIASERH